MDKMLRRTTLVCSLGGICISGGGTMVFPFLPLYLRELGVPEASLALWTAAASSLTFLVGALVMPIWGALSDRVGKKPMILRAAGSLALALFLSGLVQSPLQLLFARMFQGSSFGFFPISQALIASIGGAHTAEAIGILLSGRSAGTILGPLAGGLLSHFTGLRTAFMTAAAGDLLCFLLILLFIKEPAREPGARRVGIAESMALLAHDRAYVLLFCLMIVNQAASLIITPLVAIRVAEMNGTWAHADILSGIIVGACGGAGIIAAPFWGRLCGKRGAFPVIALSFAGAGLFGLLQFAAPTVLLFGLAQFGFGLFLIGGTTAISSAVAEVTPQEMRGSAYGLTSSAMNIGNCAGPLIGGAAASVLGIASVFAISGAALLAAALIVHKEIRK